MEKLSVVEVTRDWHRSIDKVIGERISLRVSKGDSDVSCKTCTSPGCCLMAVYMPFYEAVPIAVTLHEAGRDTSDLRARLWQAALRMESMERDTYFNTSTPCAFLENGRCSVYEDRPSACRKHFVVSPASECNPPAGGIVQLLNPGNLEQKNFDYARQAHVDLGLPETARRIFMASLPRLVYYALLVLDCPPGWREFLRRQPWPTVDNVTVWCHDGKNQLHEHPNAPTIPTV